MVSLDRSFTDSDEAALKRLVENHAAYTGSERADALLADWSTSRGRFVKVMPEAYARAISERPEADARRSLPTPAAVAESTVPEGAD